jgi:Rad3-related DNA helicase
MYGYTNNRVRTVGTDFPGGPGPLSGWGYADFHAGGNFAFTEFLEVRIAPVPEHPKPTALLADAKTGTGKSLPYLLPAALSGSRMVISTATKAFQHQLVGKDLPPAPCRLPMEKRFLTPF